MRLPKLLIVVLALFAGSAAFAAEQAALPDLATASTTLTASSAADRATKDAVCTRCHDESETSPVILTIYQTKHGVKGDTRTPTCQSCHGASEKHLKGDPGVKGRAPPDISFEKGAYVVTDARDRAAACLTCHEGTKRTHWDGSAHQSNGLACNDCHKLHTPTDPLLNKVTQPDVCFKCHKEQRADTHKISTHPIAAGKVGCSDCHNPHGSAGPKLLKKNTVVETCWTCHADKRGPFLWEHQPVAEDCTNCHTPHGSNITPLLKSRAPFLCQECHDGPHQSPSPFGPGAAGVQGGSNSGLIANGTNPTSPSSLSAARGCLNCHSMVHGSNSPAGAFLHR